jgi:hypothetical protein
VFEYSGNGILFVQKETLIKSADFYCDGVKRKFAFPFWTALNGAVKVFEWLGGKRWRPIKHDEFRTKKTKDALSIEIIRHGKNKYKAVFYDEEGIRDYYKESDAAYPEDGILEFGKTSGVTMQKVEILTPKSNGIMSQMLKLWANYGSYYEEVNFNPIKNGFVTLGNGRDFPILNEGGKIEPFSLVLTRGASSLSERQPVFYKDNEGYKRRNGATITVLSEGQNAETVDETLARINDMLASQTCITADDYAEKIKELCGDEIKKLKVINNRASNKIIVYALLNNYERKQFSSWRYELLKKLQPHKLLTVSLEIHEAKPVPVTVEGEIALDAGSGVEIQKEIESAVSKLCESEIGSPINSYILTEKLWGFPQVKRINRLNMKYDREIEDIRQTLTFLNKFSVNFIIS